MRANKLTSLRNVELQEGVSPKAATEAQEVRLATEDDRLHFKIKEKFDNVEVRGSREDLDSTRIDTSKNNEFIEQSKAYKRTNFLLMDFSGLGSYKNEERKGFMDRKHRKKMTLPQLANSVKSVNTESIDKSVPRTKMLDLMIDILKDNQEKEYYSRYQNPNPNSITPLQKGDFDIDSRFKTEPSSSKSFKLQVDVKNKRRFRGPKVIQNQILKHSTNLNIIRKKMFSENRGREPVKQRFNIQSSENERFRSCNNAKGEEKEVELLTFYPRQVAQSSEEINEFLQCKKNDSPHRENQLSPFHSIE